MNHKLLSWLSQFVRLEAIDYKSDVSNLIVDMFISDKCNLKCKHCYFGNTQTKGNLLSTQEWMDVISSFYEEGIRHFHISGRESSLDSRIPEIISYIKELGGTFTGLVSNGTGKEQYYNELINAGVDYLEFSIDGLERTHNYIRGGNIFSKVISLLDSLSGYSNIIDVSTCLNTKSIDEYFELIDICYGCGVRKFFATPFLIRGNAESFKSYSISAKAYCQLINNSFNYLETKPDNKIALKYCIPYDMILPMIEEDSSFRQRVIDYLTGKGELIYHINGNVMEISIDFFDIKFLQNISITSDGEVIPCADYISDIDYTRYSIGNVIKTEISAIIKSRAETINNNLKLMYYGISNEKKH